MVEETHSEPPSATPSHSSHASPNDTAFFPLKRRSKHLSTPTADLLCSQCRLTFANEDDIAHHMRLRHRFPCRLCLFGFESLRLLSKHRRAVHGWQCPVCLIDCYTKEEYDQHQETHHLHPCRYCWFHMDSAELREIHEEKFHYSPKCYRWDQCKRDCANRDHLDEHIRSNHHYRCRYCKDGFPIERLRHTHQAVCNGPTSCKERDYRAERDQHVEEYRDDLIKLEVRDVFSHSDQRCAKHQDDLIEFQVPDRMSHTDQLSVEHNGTAALHRLRCQQCNISFDTDERLATHFQNTHRHQCSLCEEAFPTKIILSQHITQFHYYPCPKCTWNSQTELELNQHLSEHHSSKCPFASCRLPFETEEDVRLHLAVDHARCGVCKVQFPTAEALQKHRVLAHSRGEGGAWGSASASQNSGGRPQLQHERRGSTSDEDINASSAMDADKGDESDDTDHTRLYEVDSEEDEEDEGVFLPEVERGEWGVGFARLLAAAESEDPDTSSTVREPHRNPTPTTFDPIRACKAYRHKCRKCAGVFTTVSGLRHHQATHNHPEHELVYCPLCQRAFTRNGEVDMHLSGTNRLLCPLRDHPDRDRMIAKYEAGRRDRARDRPGHGISRGSSTEVGELPPTRDTPPTATRQQQQRQQRQQQQQPQHRPRTGFRSSTMARLRTQVVADRRRRM